jgi:Protein of unknown function (DUF3551)
MRRFLLVLLTAGAAFVAANHAAARDYPFCIQGEELGGGPGDCIFRSYKQCQASASGLLGYCRMNPRRHPDQVGPRASSLASKKCMTDRPGCRARLLRVASQR